MKPFFPKRYLCVAAWALICAAPPLVAIGDDADQWVTQLSSADPTSRDAAIEKLESLGEAARPALLKAINGKDLRLRQFASPLLLRLPFDRQGDPEPLRPVLKAYGMGEVPARKDAVGRVAVHFPNREDAAPILLRLIREDPSDDVRWGILTLLHTFPKLSQTDPKQLDAGIERPPNLALAAVAYERSDPPRATALWEKCLQLDSASPTNDPEIVLIYYKLAGMYVRQHRFDDAAEMHRQGYARQPLAVINRTGSRTDHVTLLFSLHARYGPLKGFARDLEAHVAHVTRGPLLHAVARIFERGGQRAVADSLERAATFMRPIDAANQYNAAEFLLNLGMDAQAEALFEAAIASAAAEAPAPLAQPAGSRRAPAATRALPRPPTLGAREFLDARLQLALIAARRGRDFDAAERLRAIAENPLPSGVRIRTSERLGAEAGMADPGAQGLAALRAEMHWRYLRAARAKNNLNSIKAHAKELAKLSPLNPDIATDAVPALKEIGRPDDARRLFAAAYSIRKSQLAEKPDDPQRMNNVAWLCARCAENLDEARTLIDAVLKAEPDNPAYLDTAAEVNFRLGNLDEAIRLETRALELRPYDPFMRGQLERFTKAKGDRR
jgi:tetratricopeptide (TPR) repeat protein